LNRTTREERGFEDGRRPITNAAESFHNKLKSHFSINGRTSEKTLIENMIDFFTLQSRDVLLTYYLKGKYSLNEKVTLEHRKRMIEMIRSVASSYVLFRIDSILHLDNHSNPLPDLKIGNVAILAGIHGAWAEKLVFEAKLLLHAQAVTISSNPFEPILSANVFHANEKKHHHITTVDRTWKEIKCDCSVS
jgi:hypothetical protein